MPEPAVSPPVQGQPAPVASQPAGTPQPSAAISKPIAPWFVLGAGIAAVIGSFLPWVTVSAPFIGTMSASGVDISDGWFTAGAGLLLVLYGALSLRGQSINIAVPLLAGFAALGLIALGAWRVADILAKERELRADLSSSGDDIFGIGQAMSAATQIRVGNGIWLIIFAGLVGAVSTVFVAMSRRGR